MKKIAFRGYIEYLVTAILGMASVAVASVVNVRMRASSELASLLTLLITLFSGLALTYTVTVIVRHKAAVRAILRRESTVAISDLRGVRVLLVDDQEDELNVLAEALEERGAHVERASTVDGALQRLIENDPHVVLSDLAMPGDVARLMSQVKLRIASDSAPVAAIALSKYVEAFGKERIVELGFNAFLAKPILLDALVEEIQRHLSPAVVNGTTDSASEPHAG